MRDFWIASGHHLLDRDEMGRLVLTDAFLKAYLARPELVPPADACPQEVKLHHELLMHHPRRPVSGAEVAAIADADARENWEYLLAFRDRLLAAPSLEAAYVALAREDSINVPPLFVNQLVHVVLRNTLEGESDPLVLRAAELFYRPQRVTLHNGSVLLADAETIERHERERHASPLLAMLGGPAVTELDVIDGANADAYFARGDAFDMALDIGSLEARRALAKAMVAWVGHLLGIRVAIEPVERIDDEHFAWFVGLDAEATRIGNALWRGEPDDAVGGNLLALFRLDFSDPSGVLPSVEGRPVWLILAMTSDRMLRMKPQNLVAGLPLRGTAQAN